MHRMRIDPLDVEIEVEDGETLLEAALRRGLNLMHGCKEGQCGACKSVLISGDVQLKEYSVYALPDADRANGYILPCRSVPTGDVTLELVDFSNALLAYVEANFRR